MQKKKVLAILKTSRLARMRVQNVNLRPSPFKKKLIRSHEIHERNSAFFIDQLQKRFSSQYHVEVKRDLLLPENTHLTSKDYSFVFSIGGDGTYMRAANAIRDKHLPLIGVCSDAKTSVCGLKSIGLLNPDQNKIQDLFDALEDEDAQFEYRSRLQVKIKRQEEQHSDDQTLYAINQAFISDKHPTEPSWSQMRVDEEAEHGQFQNRGILVSSGSGSSAWLSSALWKTNEEVSRLIQLMNGKEINHQAITMGTYAYNQQIQLPQDSNLMMFHVREPNPVSRPEERTGLAQKEVKIKSESMNPTLFIDSFHEIPLGCEDEVEIRVNKAMDIKVPRFSEI